MKKFLLTALVSACTATCVTASPSNETAQVLKKPSDFFSPVEKTYVPGVYSSAGWKANWFAGVSGGFSTYLGHNVSENDFFGRTRWIGRAQLGKWLTPSFAARIGFDAFAFEDVDKRNENYQVYHLDLMWNPVAEFTKESAMPKWGVMPYLGIGLSHNSTFGINRFAFDYGVAAKLRVAPRIDLTAELGGVTTWRDLDGCGCCREFNANFLSLSVGAAIVIGQDGWKRVVDAKPYIKRNEDLMAYSLALRDVNRGLGARLENDQRVIAEYRKILGIEGLLGKYGSRLSALEADSIVAGNAHPRNNYSGIISLRRRLGILGPDIPVEDGTINVAQVNALLLDGANLDSASVAGIAYDGLYCGCGEGKCGEGTLASMEVAETAAAYEELKNNLGLGDSEWASYISEMANGDRCLGMPIYFFFKIRSAKIADPLQSVNLDVIAKVAKLHNLRVKIFGSADSATGNSKINNQLSMDRGECLSQELRDRGVKADRIIIVPEGGVDKLTPSEANRCSRIELYR